LLEAMTALRGMSVKLRVVGSIGIFIPDHFRRMAQIEWCGSVPRSEVENHYRWADVFIFPTLSDGFGLTQLEAQAWGLPIITSQCCGQVVTHGVNGLVLKEVTADAISDAVQQLIMEPSKLDKFVENVSIAGVTIDELGDRLTSVTRDIN